MRNAFKSAQLFSFLNEIDRMKVEEAPIDNHDFITFCRAGVLSKPFSFNGRLTVIRDVQRDGFVYQPDPSVLTFHTLNST